jgi:hypothetical protein
VDPNSKVEVALLPLILRDPHRVPIQAGTLTSTCPARAIPSDRLLVEEHLRIQQETLTSCSAERRLEQEVETIAILVRREQTNHERVSNSIIARFSDITCDCWPVWTICAFETA